MQRSAFWGHFKRVGKPTPLPINLAGQKAYSTHAPGVRPIRGVDAPRMIVSLIADDSVHTVS